MESETRNINIKWNGKPVENVKAIEGEVVLNLKRNIEGICGVPLKKQKLLFKGKILKDEDILDKSVFNDNQSIMLMGAAGIIDVAVHLDGKIAETVDAKEISGEAGNILGTGLKNLGNTCYVNSTLQVLFGLNENMQLIERENETSDKEPLYDSFVNVLKSLKKGDESFSPLDFILKLRNKFPIYAEKDKYGLYIQHDVHEFWSSFMNHISSVNSKFSKSTEIIIEKKSNDDKLSHETVNYVFLPVTSETSSLTDSIKKTFTEISQDSKISSISSFSNLPDFIPFVFMRFMWKSNEKVQAKILKLISYPKTFDIYLFASESLKGVITERRSEIPNFGIYNLNFLITHTGREADSGHYMAWTKNMKSTKGDNWFKYDDDKVSVVNEDEIMKLGGGGDRPTAYMIFYMPAWCQSNSASDKKTE